MQRNRLISDEIMNAIPSREGMSAAEWLAEQMPGGFFIYRADESMELLYINQSTCDIYGCDTVEEFRELTGNSFRGMVHPEDYDAIQSSIDEQISQPSNRRSMDYVVYRIIRKDGVVRWVDDYGHFATLPGYGEVYYVFIEDKKPRLCFRAGGACQQRKKRISLKHEPRDTYPHHCHSRNE